MKTQRENEKEKKDIEERRKKISDSISKSKEIRSRSLRALADDVRKSASGPPLFKLLEEKYRSMEERTELE